MVQSDLSFLDKHLKGINIRMMWTLITCTAVSVTTVLSVYFGVKQDIAIQNLELQLLEKRVTRLENSIYKNVSNEIVPKKSDGHIAKSMGLPAGNMRVNSDYMCVYFLPGCQGLLSAGR